MRVPLLTEAEVAEHLAKLPDWARTGGTISRTYQFADFGRAMDFVNQVAGTAAAINHHPDIDIRYNKVTLALTTHDAGGLTRQDIHLAAACDDSADAVPA